MQKKYKINKNVNKFKERILLSIGTRFLINKSSQTRRKKSHFGGFHVT